jgi:hypothetical protein
MTLPENPITSENQRSDTHSHFQLGLWALDTLRISHVIFVASQVNKAIYDCLHPTVKNAKLNNNQRPDHPETAWFCPHLIIALHIFKILHFIFASMFKSFIKWSLYFALPTKTLYTFLGSLLYATILSWLVRLCFVSECSIWRSFLPKRELIPRQFFCCYFQWTKLIFHAHFPLLSWFQRISYRPWPSGNVL